MGVRNVVLARGRLDKLERPKYAARREELRREAREAAIARDRQAAAASQNDAEESDEPEDEAAGERTTRVHRRDGPPNLSCSDEPPPTPSMRPWPSPRFCRRSSSGRPKERKVDRCGYDHLLASVCGVCVSEPVSELSVCLRERERVSE